MTTIADRPAATATRHRWLVQLGVDSAYVLVGLPLGSIAFALVLAGLAAGVALLPAFLAGIPVLAGTAYLARGLAEAERTRLASVLRRPRVGVFYPHSRPDATPLRRLFTPFTDVQYWLDALHALVRFPVNLVTASVVVVWWLITLGGLTYVLWDWTLPQEPGGGIPPGMIVVNDVPLVEVFGLANTFGNRVLVNTAIGAVFAVTLPFVVRLCALLEAWLAHAMLNGVAGLRDQVALLTRDRDAAQAQTAAAVSAEAVALRRLERDIHDGPQQRLVRIAVDLGRARQQLASDPEAAARTVDEALAQTREALDELRTLSRGIAPPILTDRGLAAAVAALAARATVPVHVGISADLPRLTPLAEQTAYFTIAEALANVAKHSGATRAAVVVELHDDRLVATITDDGRGGAHVAKGHGLAGLTDRLQAVGGELWISSPPGGPTSIRAEIPHPLAGAGDGGGTTATVRPGPSA
jgi:Signal transduction histidine kinase